MVWARVQSMRRLSWACCCVNAEDDTIKYTSATLEVCPSRLK